MQPWTVKGGLFNLPTTAEYHIPPALFPVIGKEVLKQCDPQDGVIDTIISDPVNCTFDPQKLLCGKNVTNSTSAECLTVPQISTLHKIYVNGSQTGNHTFSFPSLYLGTEAQWDLLSSSEPNPLGTDYVRYFLGLGRDWSPFDFNDDINRLADRLDPGNATVKFDLSAFHAKGGKILSYHGLSDGLIPAGSTPYFYNQVSKELEPRGIKIPDFFRFFLVPGMCHCSGTVPNMDAPCYFASPDQARSLGETVHGVPGFEDREHDIMLAMMAWVEEGVVPEKIVATKFVDDSLHTEVLRQRPMCMYPKRAQYVGSGDVNEASSWEC